MNERYGLKGGYIGLIEWIFNINRNQSFVTFAMRDMLTTSETYDQAVKYLAEVKLTAPCYYIMAGPKPGQVNKIHFLILIDIGVTSPLVIRRAQSTLSSLVVVRLRGKQEMQSSIPFVPTLLS
jgi:hypothetical protein